MRRSVLLTLLLSLPILAGTGYPQTLPVVRVTQELAAPTGELTGADIEAALEGDCEALGGCTLRLQPGTYTDVQLHICIDGTVAQIRPDCLDVETGAYPNGLIVEGPGKERTRLHSPVPVELSDTNSASVIWVDPANLDLPFFAARGFTIDGRSNLQPSHTIGDSEGTTSAGAKQMGIRIASPSLTGTHVRIEDVVFEDLMSYGTLLRDVRGGWIRGSTFTRMGCWQDVDAPDWHGRIVTGEVPCGCDSPTAGGNCAGWEDEDDTDTGSQIGIRTTGFGVVLANGDGHRFLIEGNDLAYITKVALEATKQPGDQDPDHPGQARNITFRKNKVTKARTGSTCNSCTDVDFIENSFTDIGLNGTVLEAGACMAAGRSALSRLRYIGNTCNGAMGEGIRMGGNGTGVVVKDNTIADICRECATQGFDGRGVRLRDNDQTGETLRDVVISGNTVGNSPDMEYGLYLRHWEDATISGGTYEGGTAGSILVDDVSGLELDGVEADGGGLVLGPNAAGEASGCIYSNGASLDDSSGGSVSLTGC